MLDPDRLAAEFDPDSPEPAEDHPTISGVVDLVKALRQMLLIDSRINALDSEADELKRRRAALSTAILDLMIETGMDGLPGVDGMTPYLKPVKYVTRRDNPDTGEKYTAEDVSAALIASGHPHLVTSTHNGNKLRALLREYEDSEHPLPEPLAAVVTLDGRTEIAFTAASAKRSRQVSRATPSP